MMSLLIIYIYIYIFFVGFADTLVSYSFFLKSCYSVFDIVKLKKCMVDYVAQRMLLI